MKYLLHTHICTACPLQLGMYSSISLQLNLMAAEKELKEKVDEKNEELQELRRELERERIEGGKREKEIAQLTGELEEVTRTVQQLQQQVGLCTSDCLLEKCFSGDEGRGSLVHVHADLCRVTNMVVVMLYVQGNPSN